MRMNGIRSVFSFSAAVCSANCRTTCLNDVQKQDSRVYRKTGTLPVIFSEKSESSLHKRRRLRNCEKGMEFLTCDGCEDYYYISIFKLSFPITKVSGPSNTFSINALLRNLALKHFSVWPN